MPRSSFCSTMPWDSSVRDQPERRALVHPELDGDLGDPGLAEPGQDAQDGERPVDRLDAGCRRLAVGVAHSADRSATVLRITECVSVDATRSSDREYKDAMTDATRDVRRSPSTCPDRPGIVHAVSGSARRARRQHPGEPAVRRPRPRTGSSCGCSSPSTRRRRSTSLRAAFAPVAERFGMTWELWAADGAVPDADPGLEVQPLPQRPAVPVEQRRRCRSTSPAWCRTTPTARRWRSPTACPSTTSR